MGARGQEPLTLMDSIRAQKAILAIDEVKEEEKEEEDKKKRAMSEDWKNQPPYPLILYPSLILCETSQPPLAILTFFLYTLNILVLLGHWQP